MTACYSSWLFGALGTTPEQIHVLQAVALTLSHDRDIPRQSNFPANRRRRISHSMFLPRWRSRTARCPYCPRKARLGKGLAAQLLNPATLRQRPTPKW